MKRCRKLTLKDKPLALELVETRKDAKMGKSSLPINPNWIERVINNNTTYNDEPNQLVFGLFENERYDKLTLDAIIDVKIINDYCYAIGQMMTRKHDVPVERVDNLGVNAAMLINFAIEEMEKLGYYTFYATANDVPGWKRFYYSPLCPTYNKYERTVLETIPAGEFSKVPFHRMHVSSRAFDVPMTVSHFNRADRGKNGDES